MHSRAEIETVPGLTIASTSVQSISTRRAETDATVTIVGSGNAARSLACYLAQNGYSVRLLVRSLEKVDSQLAQHQLAATGKFEGNFRLETVTDQPEIALANCRTIFIATVTTAYTEIARRLAPFLRASHEVILFSSKFAGVVEFSEALRQYDAVEVPVMETDTLFASRIQDNGSIWVRGFKQWTLFSAGTRSKTVQHAEIIKRYFPNLALADNVVQRGLTDFGALAHPLTMLANMNKVDSGTPFLFYQDGFTERTVVLLEQMEHEFGTVAHAYGTELIPMKELLNRYYGCDTNNDLLTAMRSVPNYRFSQAPDTLKHRFIEEDVACSLVPIQQLARKAGLITPLIDAVINLASALLGIQFAERGRTLKRLGWDNLSYQKIVEVING